MKFLEVPKLTESDPITESDQIEAEIVFLYEMHINVIYNCPGEMQTVEI